MKKGVWYAIICYAIWGVFPFYWKALSMVPAGEILAHRIVWSFVFVAILITLRREWKSWRALLHRRTLLTYGIASILLSINWVTYIWSVNSGFIVESSLGYFMNPLVNVLLGVIFMGERLRPMQWVPVGLAGVGVVYLAFSLGTLPWISLVLAFSFGLYGLVKKKASLSALNGITLETSILFLPALAFLLFQESQGSGAFGHAGALPTFMLALAGIITAVPLLFFADAARRIPLSMMGIIQYISPTLQFLIGVLVYGEAFSGAKIVGFGIIWLALILYTSEGLFQRKLNPQPLPLQEGGK